MTEPPEYLPCPPGYEDRVASLVADGTTSAEANWMAACEALGAVARRGDNHPDLFWHPDPTDEQRAAWDRIADREGKRFYFHQRLDTLVGYLSHGRHEARLNTELGHKRQDRLVAFIKGRNLWADWVATNRTRLNDSTEGNT